MNIKEAIKRRKDIDRLQKGRKCFERGCENCDDGNMDLCAEFFEIEDFLCEELKKLERLKKGIQDGLYGKCEKLIKQIDENIKLIQAR